MAVLRFPSTPMNVLLLVLGFLGSWVSVRAAPTDIPSAASFYVHRLPDLHQDEERPLTMFAGHLSSDPEARSAPATAVTAHLFFVMVKAKKVADKERIMFWFNGGPGCSSFDGLMMETGPWRMDGNGGISAKADGWQEYTTMVFLDQPAGTGYSYTSTDRYVHELDEMGKQVVEFMRNFYQVFPEYEQMDTYLGGESYAGQYIPYIADAMLSSSLRIPLKGAAIGNGWMDARRQYPAYFDFAVKAGILQEGTDKYNNVKTRMGRCQNDLDRVTIEPIHVPVCENIVSLILATDHKTEAGLPMCINMYDVRLEDESPACGMNWPPELPQVYSYLGRSDVKAAFHATAKAESWVECSGRVSQELRNRNSQSSITLLPKVLSQIPVLLFAGDQDFICNYMGIESMIQTMTWNGETGLGTVETKSWSVNGNPAGTWVDSRNLTYVKVFNSSHMVPYDVPQVSHDMILRFMGVNFSMLADGLGSVPSKVGNEDKPVLIEKPKEDAAAVPPVAGKSPEQDKAMWEAYYNAGSAALVLVLIALAIGLFLFCRRRRRPRFSPVALESREEETIPLSTSVHDHHEGQNGYSSPPNENGDNKGKGRMLEEEGETIFDLGSDDEGENHHKDR